MFFTEQHKEKYSNPRAGGSDALFYARAKNIFVIILYQYQLLRGVDNMMHNVRLETLSYLNSITVGHFRAKFNASIFSHRFNGQLESP